MLSHSGLALLLAAAALAGCLGDGGTPPATPDANFDSDPTSGFGDNSTLEQPPTGPVNIVQAAGALRLVAQVQMPASTGLIDDAFQFEPSVVVHRDGAIVVTAADGLDVPPLLQSSALWVSQDAGKTFTQVADVQGTDVAKSPIGAEGHMAVGADGALYFVEMVDLYNHAVSRSGDGGRTWELVNPAVFLDTAGDRPWIAAGSPGTVVVVASQLATRWVAVSQDGGATFPTQTPLDVPVAPTYHGRFMSSLVVDSKDRIYLAGADLDGIWMHRSLDLGKTFEAVQVYATANTTSNIFAVPAVDAAGTAYVAWGRRRRTRRGSVTPSAPTGSHGAARSM